MRGVFNTADDIIRKFKLGQGQNGGVDKSSKTLAAVPGGWQQAGGDDRDEGGVWQADGGDEDAGGWS